MCVWYSHVQTITKINNPFLDTEIRSGTIRAMSYSYLSNSFLGLLHWSIHNTWFHLIFIVAVVCILYFPTIWYQIIVDDIKHYQWIKASGGWGNILRDGLRSATNWWDIVRVWFFFLRAWLYGGGIFGVVVRPRRVKTMAGEYVTIHEGVQRIDGVGTPVVKDWVDYRPDHCVTLLLWCVAVCLVYAATRSFASIQTAFAVAFLYAVTPVNTQLSIWLNGRRYLLTVIVALVMLVTGWWWLYPLGFMFQLTAVFVPLLFLKDIPWWTYALMSVMAVPTWIMVREKMELRMSKNPEARHHELSFRKLVVICKSFGWYWVHMWAPGRVQMSYKFLYWWGRTVAGNRAAYSMLTPDFLKGIVAVGIAITGIFLWTGFDRLLWVVMVLSILQWSCILSFVQFNTDRYLSVAVVFGMYFLVRGLQEVLGGSWMWGVGIVGSCYILWTLESMVQYRSMYDFFQYHLFHAPTLSNIRMDMVKGCLSKDDILNRMEAMLICRRGIKVSADYNTIRYTASCCRLWGNLDEAYALSQLALSQPFVGKEDQARKDHEEFIKLLEADVRKAQGSHKGNGEVVTRQQRRAKERATAAVTTRSGKK